MRKIALILMIVFTMTTFAQEHKSPQVPQISVSGEGKIKVTPDITVIQLGVQNNGKEAAEVKKQNDIIIEKVIKYIKKHNIPATDFQTSQMSLYKNYDYQTKKYTFQANQSITVTLKNIAKYDAFMMDVMDTGINTISGVEFKSSKMAEYESDARKKAMLNAKKKAEDYVSVLNQKIGKAILISDNTQVYYPQPMFKGAAMTMAEDASAPRETLAVGEIEITANVQVSFQLD
ncbi:SIMPL domain-containing protein [Flavobacterium pedocola]